MNVPKADLILEFVLACRRSVTYNGIYLGATSKEIFFPFLQRGKLPSYNTIQFINQFSHRGFSESIYM